MIILIEGPDCSGKTTLAEGLVKSLSAGYADSERSKTVKLLHAGRPKDGTPLIRQYLDPLVQALDPQVDLVLDRWHVGELVYGHTRRNGPQLTDGQVAYIELVMASVGYFGIHCEPNVNVLKRCFAERGDDDPDVTESRLINEAAMFSDLLSRRTQWMHLDPRETNVEDLLVTAPMTYTTPAPFAQFPLWARGAYIGKRFPRVLLVGDRRNPNDKRERMPWPFVPQTGTSGLWMFDSLVRCGVSVDELGFINGQERRPDELVGAWKALGQPPVVALGKFARDALVKADIPISVQTNHPQWWRRFHHHRHGDFADAIVGAIQ